MTEAKGRKPRDLSTLDGNALAERLAVVKDRMLDLMDQSSPLMLVARADSEAVLDECGIRLLDPGPEHLRAQILSDDVGRLRALIRAVVAMGPDVATPTFSEPILWELRCKYCSSRPGDHFGSCPWPALVAEAAKP
jgi:hypothetical protein